MRSIVLISHVSQFIIFQLFKRSVGSPAQDSWRAKSQVSETPPSVCEAFGIPSDCYLAGPIRYRCPLSVTVYNAPSGASVMSRKR